MYFKNNFISSIYYSSCDLFNKFNLKSIYKKPKIKSIIFEISFNDFFNILDNTEVQIKSFNLFYFWILAYPFVKFFKLSTLKDKNKEFSLNYILKVIFSSNTSINTFLISIFLENSQYFHRNSLKLLNSESNQNLLGNSKYISYKKVNFQFLLPCYNFFDFHSLLNSKILSANFKDLNFKLNFSIFNLGKSLFSLRNLPLFWLSYSK